MIKVVCYTYLAATIIFLNIIERKYKRQIFPPDPIILAFMVLGWIYGRSDLGHKFGHKFSISSHIMIQEVVDMI